MPVRILIALFPKLTLYEFRLEKAPFPEFLKVLEKMGSSRILIAHVAKVKLYALWILACWRHFPEFLRVLEKTSRDGFGRMDKPVAVVAMAAVKRMDLAAAVYLLLACCPSYWLSQR